MAEATARIIEIANVFVTDLNTEVAAKEPGTSPQHGDGAARTAIFTADRVYQADFSNTDLQSLRVSVRTIAQQLKEDDRGGHATLMMLEIAVQKLVRSKNEENDFDALVNLSDRIAQRYGKTLVPCSPGNFASAIRPAYPVFVAALGANWSLQVTDAMHEIFNPDKLAQGRFVSRIVLTLDE